MTSGSAPQLTLITGCKGRLASLRVALPSWLAVLDRLGVGRVVVVDFDCPDGTADYVHSLGDPRLLSLNVPGQPTYNPAVAKNAGTTLAVQQIKSLTSGDVLAGGWLLYIDADVSLHPDFADLLPTLDPAAFYHADQKRPGILGTFLVHSSHINPSVPHPTSDIQNPTPDLFDETFQGWGWEDVDAYETLRLRGLAERTFPHSLLSHLDHPDADRTRFAPDADLKRNALANMAYACAKSQLQRISGELLSTDRRAWLYSACRDLAQNSLNAHQPAQLPLELASQFSGDWTFSAHLVFTLSPPSSTTASDPPPSRPRR